MPTSVVQLLKEMYPDGIKPDEYSRVITLITRLYDRAPSAPRPAAAPPAPAPKRQRAASASAAAPKRRGRPPTGNAVPDRMAMLLQSRGAMTVPEIAQELDVHTASVYAALPKIHAERVEESGHTVVKLTQNDGA